MSEINISPDARSIPIHECTGKFLFWNGGFGFGSKHIGTDVFSVLALEGQRPFVFHTIQAQTHGYALPVDFDDILLGVEKFEEKAIQDAKKGDWVQCDEFSGFVCGSSQHENSLSVISLDGRRRTAEGAAFVALKWTLTAYRLRRTVFKLESKGGNFFA